MPRTKEFDPDVAVALARDLFWRQGYEATSVDDLVDHLGIGRQSLYATFGSKKALYLKALDRYREVNAAGLIETLAQPGPVLPLLEGVLLSCVESAVEDPDRRGCFLVNAAMERIPGDHQTGDKVGATFDMIEEALAGAISRGQATGEIRSERPAGELASFMLAAIQGLRVVGKATPDRRRLASAVTVAISALH